MACEHGSPADGPGYRKEQKPGYAWGGWFKVPDDARASFPSDGMLADAADMRAYVQAQIGAKLKSLIEEEFAGVQNSPLDASANTETRLKRQLEEWYRYLQETWGLFKPRE